MSLHQMAAMAYADPRNANKSPRAVEYQLLAQITRRMQSAADGGATRFSALLTAVDENRTLWVEFAQDLAFPENPLPLDLKRNLVQLAGFVVNESDRIARGQAECSTLIDINIAVMKGLGARDQ
ncbi:MAG: flagellar biosynthesis regulator FlaF [Roseinatronobacter sp.]